MNRDDSTVGQAAPEVQERVGGGPDDVVGRFRRARRAGRPAWLWPEIPVSDWRAALVRLEAIVRSLLTRVRPEPVRAANAAAAQSLGLAAYTSGLGPWLGWQIEAGRLEADERSTGVLAEHLEHSRRRWTRVDTELSAVLRALERAGIEATVIKGAWGAQCWFAEPSLRPMADIDLLVEPQAMNATAQVLGEAGWYERIEGRNVQPLRMEWRRRGSAVLPQSLMFVHADDPIAIDVHASLDIDFFGVATVAFGMPDRAAVAAVAMGGARARVLTQPLLAAHHAVHASHGLHGLTLIRLLELTLMLRRDMNTAARWSALDDLLRERRAERFAWPALALAEQLAPGSVQPALLERCAAASPPRLRRVIESLRPATAQRLDGLALQERFMWSRDFREHVRRAANMLLPTGRSGPVSRLGRIYAERAWRLMRLRVGWSAERT